MKSLTRRPTPTPSKTTVGTSINIESSASRQTPSPLSQDDLAAQLRPTLNGMAGQPSSLVEDGTAEPTTWETLIVIEDNAAHDGKQMILLELLALMLLLLNHII